MAWNVRHCYYHCGGMNMNYTITLTDEQLKTIMQALSGQPWGVVNALIVSIVQQTAPRETVQPDDMTTASETPA